MRKKFHVFLLFASVLAFLSSLVFFIRAEASVGGPLMIAGFALAAIAIRGFEALKGISYTIWIFTAVTVSMVYPSVFTSVGDFQLKRIIVPLLQIIMFGMGSQMSFNDFTGVIKMPRGVIVGVVSHYMIMPLVGFGIAHIFKFPAEIAAGIILIGCVPSGLASNVMSYLAKANLALAVTIGAISTLLSPLITPLLMKWLGGQYIQVDFWSMMLDILNMIILPIIAGFIFNLFLRRNTSVKKGFLQMGLYLFIICLTAVLHMTVRNSGFTGFMQSFIISMVWFYIIPAMIAILISLVAKENPSWIEKGLSFVSMTGIALIVAVITAAGHESLMKVGLLLLVTSLLHNVCGYSLGYSLSWLLGMPERDRRTIAFEVGMQNGGLASGLALQMGKVATVGLAPAIFGPLMNITGSVLANWWRGKPIKDDVHVKP